ncbi:MAG: LUD domain-containing protein [Clostridium fessum]
MSQTLFGPEKVYFVIGNNKVCPDLTSAMERAKQIAAPKNAARLQVQTPCAKTGVCVDCNSPARICHSIVIDGASEQWDGSRGCVCG